MVIVGNPQDKELIENAKSRFGNRFKHFFVTPTEISEFYKIADVFTLASVVEGFSNVLLEAISNGIPAIMHDRLLHKWALEKNEFLINMEIKGSLSKKINSLSIDELKNYSDEVSKIYKCKYTWLTQNSAYQNLLLRW